MVKPDDFVKSYRIRHSVRQALPFWVASLIVGLISVAYAQLFGYAEQLMQKLFSTRHAIFIAAPLCFIAAWYIVRRLAPNARGSGIPQVMAAIETPSKDQSTVGRLLGLRIIVVKVISSLLMVVGGGAVGREGPTIQISASVFYVANKLIPATWSKLSQKNFIITGAAAGLAAAFNTPLGGVVFAVEELAKIHISNFRTALFSAVIIAGLTAQAISGPYLYLGYPDVKDSGNLIFLMVIAVAIASGLLGALMSKAILKLMHWKDGINATKTIVLILTIGLLVATVAYFVDSNILGSGKELMKIYLSEPAKHVSFSTVICRIVGPVLAFNVGAAGGIFAPALAAGASIGGLASDLLSITGPDSNILVLTGMAAFLTGVTRTPFTAAILVLEMTDRHNIIFHLMLASLIASLVSLLIDEVSIYEHLSKKFSDA